MRIRFFTLLILSLQLALAFHASAAPVVVNFPDPNLEAAIRLQAKLPAGPITDVQLAQITNVLILSRAGITDLSGIEYCVNLRVLSLDGNSIVDVSPLSSLIALEELHLSGNKIQDISTLGGLGELSKLFLGDNEISDVTPLIGLTKLKDLYAQNNRLTTILPLIDLPATIRRTFRFQGNPFPAEVCAAEVRLLELRNIVVAVDPTCGPPSNLSPIDISDPVLEAALRAATGTFDRPLNHFEVSIIRSLYIDGPVQDLTGLEHCTYLTFLDINNGAFTSAALVSSLKYLVTLRLTNGSLADIPNLSQMKLLYDLDLSRNQITDAAALLSCDTLTDVVLDENPWLSMPSMTALPELRSLSVSNVRNVDFTRLASTSIRELRLNDAGLTDVSFLSSMHPRIIYINNNNVSDLNPLASNSDLEILDASSNQIADLSPFQGLTLFSLNLADNNISDLASIAGATIEGLDLSDNQIANVQPLSLVSSLASLTLRNNLVSDLSSLSGNESLLYMVLDNNRISEVDWASGLPNLILLSLANNAIQSFNGLTLQSGDSLNLSGNQITDLSDYIGPDAWSSTDLTNNPLADVVCTEQIPALAALGKEVISDGCGPRPIAACVASLDFDLAKQTTLFPVDLDAGSSDPRNRPLQFSVLDVSALSMESAEDIYAGYRPALVFNCDDVARSPVSVSLKVDNGLSWDTCEVQVNILTSDAPAIRTRNATVQLSEVGTASVSVEDINDGSTGTCNFSLALSQTEFSCADLGAKQIALIGTYLYGSTASATAPATVNVLDAIPPTAAARDLMLPLGPDGTATLDPVVIGGGSRDNCLPILSLSQSRFTCDDVGENLVTLTVSDTSGNTAEANAVITVTAAPGLCEDPQEGELEGGPEGSTDGAMEGAAEGVYEGSAEGAIEGTVEGEEEGSEEGLLEGASDGENEGEGEGGPDGIFDCQGCNGDNKSLFGMGDLLTLLFSMAALLAMQRPLRR